MSGGLLLTAATSARHASILEARQMRRRAARERLDQMKRIRRHAPSRGTILRSVHHERSRVCGSGIETAAGPEPRLPWVAKNVPAEPPTHCERRPEDDNLSVRGEFGESECLDACSGWFMKSHRTR